MNKTITIAVSTLIGLALPVIGMTITPTREALLSLTTPDEKILSLADKIDEQRVLADESKAASDAKLAEFQSTIDDQQARLAEQQKLIDENNEAVLETKSAVKDANDMTDKLAKEQCEAEKKLHCSDKYLTKKSFDKYLDDFGDDLNSEMENDLEKRFNRCQNILKSC